jgi:membrane protease subunit HflC
MKNLPVLIFVILIVGVLALLLFSFQVRETESALVTKFGKPSKTITSPGWHGRWPAPIQNVHKFDSRNHLYEGLMEETTTKGGEPIVVTSYIVWKITDPLKFLESVGDVETVKNQLKSLLRDTQNSVIGEHYFSEFVNTDPAKIKFFEIEEQMLSRLNRQTMAEYGIEISLVGIKRIGISEKVTKEVFERMKADRQRRTKEITAQGEAEAIRIMTDAESKRQELLAMAETQAEAIRGEGDAEAAEHYKMLEADPKFAMFLRNIEALKEILKNETTIILGADTEPMKLLRGIGKED